MAYECGECHKSFGGLRAFDQHRVGPWGDRRCLGAEEMRAKGMEGAGDRWSLPAPTRDPFPDAGVTESRTETPSGGPSAGGPSSSPEKSDLEGE